MPAGALAVGDRLHQGVAAEAVCTVDRHAGALTRRVETFELGAPVEVGVDAAHMVVGPRAHRNRLVDRIDPGVGHRQLAGSVQALDDLLRAEVAHVEQNVAVDAAALVDLGLLRT